MLLLSVSQEDFHDTLLLQYCKQFFECCAGLLPMETHQIVSQLALLTRYQFMHKNCSTWHLLVGWVGFIDFICCSVYELNKVPSSELMHLLFKFEYSGIYSFVSRMETILCSLEWIWLRLVTV